MGDLKTPFDRPIYPDTGDLSGAGVTSRGSDPSIDAGGDGGALTSYWKSPTVPIPGGEETGNSVSSLPARPNRFEPSETPPEPPSLQDRNPGTIDQQ